MRYIMRNGQLEEFEGPPAERDEPTQVTTLIQDLKACVSATGEALNATMDKATGVTRAVRRRESHPRLLAALSSPKR